MTGDTNGARTSRWTPEQLIQLFKEIVTAGIGIALVVYTFAWPTLLLAWIAAGRSISGRVLSFKIGAAAPVKQPFCSQLEDRNFAKAEVIQVSINRSERRKRVAMIRWVLRFPDMIESLHKEMWRVGFGRDPTADELRSVDDKMRDITNYHARIRIELPGLFHSTSPSELAIGMYNEVYPAFEREFSSCLEGLFKLERFLTHGLKMPVEGGGTVSIPFREIYRAIDIEEAKRTLRMAAEQISYLFPPDETEEAIRGGNTVIEEYIMGDKFENITESTIISRSHVEHAFNRTEEKLGEEVASAILEIAQYVDRSGNPAAGAVFNEFTREVNQDKPDKSKLRQCWDGLIAILPDIATLAGAVAAVSKLFS